MTLRSTALVLLAAASSPLHAAPTDGDLVAEAVAALTRSLGDADRGVRYAAAQALGKWGSPAEVLAGALRDRDRVVQREAAWWIRRKGGHALDVLSEAFSSEDPSVRSTVAWALSGLGPSAVPLLRRALADSDLEVRLEGLRSARLLGRDAAATLASDVVRSLNSPAAEEAYEASRTLVRLAPERGVAAVPGIVEGLRKGIVLESDAVELLVEAGPPAQAALGELSAKDPRLAARLQWIRTRDATPRPAPLVPDDAPVAVPGLRRESPSEEPEEWKRALDHGPVLARVRAAILLGEAHAASETVASALDDPERDVRAAAVKALAKTKGDSAAVLVLRRALSDTDWRVRLAAVESLGARRAEVAQDVAPFLADPHPAVSYAAAEALRSMGAGAAEATALQVATGHYGVLHYAPAIFGEVGEEGAVAVPRLVPLLGHPDPNVREAAARSLFGVGHPDATPALMGALADERLCVVSHAALALGRIGLSKGLVDTLSHRLARVRAYGAFAIGWALGTSRDVDQVPFEVRMPVLDAGESGPFPSLADLESIERRIESERLGGPVGDSEAVLSSARRRAIWSPDPSLSVHAAKSLDYRELDARESERVMELLLPEGFRPGSGVDLDQVREIVGSSELPALLTFLMLSGPTTPPRGAIYGALHRTSRADSLPAIYWFHRNDERALRDDSDGEIRMPEERTIEPLRVRATKALGKDPGPDRDEVLRALLGEELRDERWGLSTPALWLLNGWTPATPGDVRLVLRAAQATEEGTAHRAGAARLAALRALGRCSDRASEAHLRMVESDEVDEDARWVAVAALARRGDSASLMQLLEESRTEPEAQILLLDTAPRIFAETLIERLARARSEHDVAAALDPDWSETATRLGVRVDAAAFWGVEAEVARRVSAPVVLGTVAVAVPTCRTRRMGERLFEALSASRWPDVDEEDEGWSRVTADAVAAFLHSVDPERLLLHMRSLAGEGASLRGSWARATLLQLGDRPSGPMLFRWLREDEPEGVYDEWIERFGGPEAVEYFREQEGSERNLQVLARLAGWPKWTADFDPDAYAPESRAGVVAAIRRGDVRAALRAHPRAAELADPLGPPTPVWRRLAISALLGDSRARGELWSGLRAGRLRWIHTTFEGELQTMGHDPSLLPHWLSDLDSNCCRVSDGMAQGVFERPLGVPDLYGSEAMGVGEPLSRRARTWLELAGGSWVSGSLSAGGYGEPQMIPSPE